MRKFGLAVLFLIGFVSLACACEVPEEISFAGIVYEDHIGWDVIGDVDVWVSCGVVALDTTYADGAYGVSFSGEDCVDGGDLEMRFSKDGFEDLSFGEVINYSDMWTIDLGDMILRNKVFNVVMVREEEEDEIRRGGDCKELFLDCGLWSSCIDGIETRTCVSNCEAKDEVRICDDEEPLVLDFFEYPDEESQEKGGFMDFILGLFGE
jgi:hypothetical protein